MEIVPFLRAQKFSILAGTLGLLATGFALAQSPAAGNPDVWGKAPEARDDRFMNPKGPLYAGPDGWWNTGEVRATVANPSRTPYAFTGGFQSITGGYAAVKELQTLFFDFGDTQSRPTPGTYQIGPKGSIAEKTVRLSFSDLSSQQLREWASTKAGAGTLTISLVHGFTYFTCRNVVLPPTGLHNKAELANPLTIGFEGALSPE